MREIIHLGCMELHKKEIIIRTWDKRVTTGKIELKKFCKWCKRHTVHREMKL